MKRMKDANSKGDMVRLLCTLLIVVLIPFILITAVIHSEEKVAAKRQLPIRKHREERENGIASAVPFSHFSVDAVTFDISKTPIPL